MTKVEQVKLRNYIAFRFESSTKREVYNLLSSNDRIESFIIGDMNNSIFGEVYTPKKTMIFTLEPKFLKLDKRRQGVIILEPDFDVAERIMSVDPTWMVKGNKWPASDLVGGAPGSIVPFVVPPVGPSGVMPVDPPSTIPPSTIQTILIKLEGLESRLGVSDAVPVNTELSTENERIKREKEELKEENESLKVQLAETRETTEGGESKYLETIGKLKEENIRVKRQNKDLEQRLRETEYQLQRLDEEANIAQRTILELREKCTRLEKNVLVSAPGPATAPSPTTNPPAITIDDVILEPEVDQDFAIKLISEYDYKVKEAIQQGKNVDIKSVSKSFRSGTLQLRIISKTSGDKKRNVIGNTEKDIRRFIVDVMNETEGKSKTGHVWTI
jgi:hypothetical protein